MLALHLERPAVAIDVEATGPDPVEDAIFEFAAVLIQPDGTRKTWVQNFKPWKDISPGAAEVTGRKTEEFANCPPFSEWAARIHKAMAGKDIIGYNVARFDLVILDQELRRCGLKLDLAGVNIIDPQGIFFKSEPRDLSAAVKRYCGREHEGAHGAAADAEAALDVLLGQMMVFADLREMPIAELATYSRVSENAPVDIAGKLYRDAEGAIRFAFGKNKDRRVTEELGYARWMLEKGSFPGSTLDAIREELEKC